MALVLAVDTTHEHGSIALARDRSLIEEITLEAPTGFAHVIYEHLAALLRRHHLRIADIDLFAAASGPGSFTGVRVGLACIKGLAEAAGRPAVAVSNLKAIASFGTAKLRAVHIDARRNEIYGAVYDDRLRLVCPEVVMPKEAWLAGLPAGSELLGTPPALAAAIARLALDEKPQDPAALDANYVRRSDAELFWKE